MSSETKAFVVKRPSNDKTYVLFAKTLVTDGMIGICVAAVVEPIMVPGVPLPFPREISGREMVEIVEECLPQIRKYAETLGARYDEAHRNDN